MHSAGATYAGASSASASSADASSAGASCTASDVWRRVACVSDDRLDAHLTVGEQDLGVAIQLLCESRCKLLVVKSVQDVDVVEALLDHALLCWSTAATARTPHHGRNSCCALCLNMAFAGSWVDVIPRWLRPFGSEGPALAPPMFMCTPCFQLTESLDARITEQLRRGSGACAHDDDDDDDDAHSPDHDDAADVVPTALLLPFAAAALCFRAVSRPVNHDLWTNVNLNVLAAPHRTRFAHVRELRRQLFSHWDFSAHPAQHHAEHPAQCPALPEWVFPSVPWRILCTSALPLQLDCRGPSPAYKADATAPADDGSAAAAFRSVHQNPGAVEAVWWGPGDARYGERFAMHTVVCCGPVTVLCPWDSVLCPGDSLLCPGDSLLRPGDSVLCPGDSASACTSSSVTSCASVSDLARLMETAQESRQVTIADAGPARDDKDAVDAVDVQVQVQDLHNTSTPAPSPDMAWPPRTATDCAPHLRTC